MYKYVYIEYIVYTLYYYIIYKHNNFLNNLSKVIKLTINALKLTENLV